MAFAGLIIMGSDKTKLRRYEDDLNVSGTGVILMGGWAVVRVLIEVFLQTKPSEELAKEAPEDRLPILLIVIGMVVIVSAVVMTIHLYIGLNAMRAAKGVKHSRGYYYAAIILLILSVFGLFSYKEEIKDIENIDTTIASILVDLTTIYILAVTVISTRRIRSIKKSEAGEVTD